MSKLRSDYFESVGGKLFKGDECFDVDNKEPNVFSRVISENEAFMGQFEFNGEGFGIYNHEDRKKLVITSFAERETNGVQPVPDSFPVSIVYESGDKWSDNANCFDWNIRETHDNVKSWKPDHEALLKMQSEHDKHNRSIIKACDEASKKESEMIYTQEMKDNGEQIKFGMKYLNRENKECVLVGVHGELNIGELEVKDMAGLHSNYLDVTPALECKPLKTPQEIEKENAKKEQVTYYAEKYFKAINDIDTSPRGLFELMQSNGDLPEL